MKLDSKPAFIEVIEELRKVKGNDRAIVLTANGYCELLAEALVQDKCKNKKRIKEDSRNYPYSSKLLILNEIGAISNSLYRHLDAFRKLRNKAAHNAIFRIGTTDKNDFLKIKGQQPDLGKHCIMLLILFWKEGGAIFSDKFPKQKQAEQGDADSSDG